MGYGGEWTGDLIRAGYNSGEVDLADTAAGRRRYAERMRGRAVEALLAPSLGSKQPLTLSLSNTLTCKADSTYTCQLSTSKRPPTKSLPKA